MSLPPTRRRKNVNPVATNDVNPTAQERQPGGRITSIDGEPTASHTLDEVRTMLTSLPIGEPVDFEFRSGQTRSIIITDLLPDFD